MRKSFGMSTLGGSQSQAEFNTICSSSSINHEQTVLQDNADWGTESMYPLSKVDLLVDPIEAPE